MIKAIAVLLVSPLCLAAPQVSQVGFGDASPDEIAQIRSGTYLETFDDNPQYSFNWKVADDTEQNYMAMEENRDGDQVTGSYQYVDPFGSLIIVTYTAGAMGYSETREVRKDFVRINPRPQRPSSSSATSSNTFSAGSNGISSTSTSSGFSSAGSTFTSRPQSTVTFTSNPGSSASQGQTSFSSSSQSSQSSLSSDDILSAVISQVQPLISQAVSSAVTGATEQSDSFGEQSSFSSSSQALTSNAGQTTDDEIVSSIVSQLQPLVPQTVSSAFSGSNQQDSSFVQNDSSASSSSSSSTGQTSFSTSSQSTNSDDIVSTVVSQVQPLISQTVSSAILGSSGNTLSQPAIPSNRPRPARPSVDSSDIGSVSDIFGAGGNY